MEGRYLFRHRFLGDHVWRDEDAHGGEDQVEGEDPETESVDDHRGELPIVRLVLLLRILLHLLRYEPQLGQYCHQFVTDGQQAGVVGHVRPRSGACRPPVSIALAVDADRPIDGEVDAGEGHAVVEVLDVRKQAQRGRSLRFQLAEASLPQQYLPTQGVAGSGHPQKPGQPFAHETFHLEEERIYRLLRMYIVLTYLLTYLLTCKMYTS